MSKTKIFKYGNSQAVSINKSLMEEAGLEVGDTLQSNIVDGYKIIFEKIEELSYEEQIKEYYQNGGRHLYNTIHNQDDGGNVDYEF